MKDLQENPNLLRSRNDPKTTKYLINKYLRPAQQQLQETNKKILHYYQAKPAAKPNTAQPQVDKIREAKIYKMEKAKTEEPSKTVIRDHRTQPAVKEKTQNPAVTRRNEAVRATRVRPRRTEPDNPYYTLAIEVSRETDVMSHRTYLLTFRLIE